MGRVWRRLSIILYPSDERSFVKIKYAKHSPSQTIKKALSLMNEIPTPKTTLQQYLKICTKCNIKKTICKRHYAVKKVIDIFLDNNYPAETELYVGVFEHRDLKGKSHYEFETCIQNRIGYHIHLDEHEATVCLPVIHPLPRAIVYPHRKTNPNSYLFLAHTVKEFLKRVLFSI